MPDGATDDRLPDDRVSADLRALTDWLPTRVAGAADVDVEREPGTTQVVGAIVTPHRRRAVAVGWDQSDGDHLNVALGGGLGCDLPRTRASVATLREVIDAAAAGTVEVRIANFEVHYRVRLQDGTFLEDTTPTLTPWRSASWRAALTWTPSAPYA